MYYRIYAKFPGQNQFRPLDLSTGQQVINLIHATLLNEYEIHIFNKICKDNEDVQFKLIKA